MQPTLDSIKAMRERFAPTVIDVDISQLSAGDRQALIKIIESARILDGVVDQQTWAGCTQVRQFLRAETSLLGQELLGYFDLNGGPWSALDHNQPFVEGVPARPPIANFYPADLTAEEFDAWLDGLDADERALATGFFSVIRRDALTGELVAVPFSTEYNQALAQAARLLREAAQLTDNQSLRTFLQLRADALLSNDYVESDIAWLELDSPIELCFGPYETYMDEFVGAKAAFEAYVSLVDQESTALLAKFSQYMQFIEDHLPVDARYRNANVATSAPIRVVNLILGTGYAKHGVQTSAFNLPNDPNTTEAHGTKQTMLRNIQQAKFEQVLMPIARMLLNEKHLPFVSFNAFFTFVLKHEMCHGLGPHNIIVDGRQTSVREELKNLYSAIEECKADVCGLFALQLLADQGELPPELVDEMYVTFVAGLFRSIRFGIMEAHGKGNAVQLNWLRRRHAIVLDKTTGTFTVHSDRVRKAMEDLARRLLTIEAEGDYDGAKALLEELGVISRSTQKVLRRLASVPVDIEPAYVTADELAGSA